MNLVELLSQQAAARPAALALIAGGRGRLHSLTFAGLEDAAGRAAAYLAVLGLRPGDTVLIFHPMAVELYVALAAIFRNGLTALFIDPSQGREHIERCCQLAPPRALLATPRAHLLRLISPALRRIPVKIATGLGAPGASRWQQYRHSPTALPVLDCAAETPALITFTSGSTGLPKAAVRTQGFLLQQHTVLDETLALTPDDRVLTHLPIFVLSHLAAGVGVLIPQVDIRYPGRVNAGALVPQVQAHAVTCIEGSPAFLERIITHCEQTGQRLPGITRIFTGGAPVFPQILSAAQRVAPRAAVMAVYGSTEAEPVAHIAEGEIGQVDRERMASGAGLLAGRPVGAVEVAILPDRWGEPLGPYTDAEWSRMGLPPGEVGEIVVTGPHVLAGYLGGRGDEETKIRVGARVWHRTGDAGYFDDVGRLWLVGRCAAKVSDSRGILYPLTVEAAAQQTPSVRRSALVTHGGKRLLAVESHEPLQPAQLQRLREALGWAQIDAVIALRRIPVDRRHNAKIDYPALQRLVAHRPPK
jgi:acyl-CoA synthetase (AMP-forming)/AMP-acid ligase II